jgi:ABC-2 type transport system ATP-binding protein
VIENAIEAKKLTKKFGEFVAVDNITFNVKKGEVFGFLGPNGAGKTTTIRMLCGIMDPTSGEGKVGGYDITAQGEEIKKIVGYMSQKFSLYEDLTVVENLEFYSGIYQIAEEKRKRRIDEMIERSELFERMNDLTANLATSLKQHLALSCALVHDPRIVFLDEPTAGVDPLARKKFWGLIKELSARGMTFLVTTHYMDEAEECDRLALINNGLIIACDDPSNLKLTAMRGSLLEIDCDNVMMGLEILRRLPEVFDASLYGLFLHAVIREERALAKINGALEKNGIKVRDIRRITPSLEDVFVSLIEESEKKRFD